MKNLANCTPREFLKQGNRIRKSIENWLSLTKVLDIRKRMPNLDGMTEEEKRAAINKQMKENLSAMLDAALDEYHEETVELLALICFVEPEDIDNYKMADFIGSISEILNNREVLSFFTSLVKLGQAGGSVQ